MACTTIRRFFRTTLSLSALALLITGAVLYAGPLNPPAGPVTGTYKTLTDVEPRTAINATNTPGDADSFFKITQPGSYYLTGNITGVVGKHGIEITASGVTLDLNGFDLLGVAGMSVFDGVNVTASGLTNIAVVNGSVRNWGQDGINMGDIAVPGCRIEGVRASGNVRIGIYVGNQARVSGCSATGGFYGVYAGSGATLTGCSAYNNTASGINGLSGSTVTDCSAYGNTGSGISLGSGCTVSNCSAISNAYIGISATRGVKITNCSATYNTGNGIVVGGGSIVSNCLANNSSGSGIVLGNDSTVTACTTTGNQLDGISATERCTVMNCSASINGLGIHVTGSTGRYDGDVTVSNIGDGMKFNDGTIGNLITRNYSAGNGGSQFRLEGGTLAGVSGPTRNECAPIFSPAPVNGVWPDGNTNAWANQTR